MRDLISRQGAFDGTKVDEEDCTEYDIGYNDGIDFAVSKLSVLPSAQPEITLESAIDYLHEIGWMQEHDRILTEFAQPEPKIGKWKETDDGWDGTYYVCSECGCPWTLIDGTPLDNGMNYCPNCGCKMEVEK